MDGCFPAFYKPVDFEFSGLCISVSGVLTDILSAEEGKKTGSFRTNLMEGALGFLPGAKNNV